MRALPGSFEGAHCRRGGGLGHARRLCAGEARRENSNDTFATGQRARIVTSQHQRAGRAIRRVCLATEGDHAAVVHGLQRTQPLGGGLVHTFVVLDLETRSPLLDHHRLQVGTLHAPVVGQCALVLPVAQ